jgi:hypothetical protein
MIAIWHALMVGIFTNNDIVNYNKVFSSTKATKQTSDTNTVQSALSGKMTVIITISLTPG